MKNCLFFTSVLSSFIVLNCMEDGEDPSRRANKPLWNETYADALKRDLLVSYDKFARPMQHYNTTKVLVDLKIKHIDFDGATSILTVYAWFKMEWNDEKLKWNKSLYGNLSRIGLAQHEIWQPDITLYNSVTHNQEMGATYLLVESNGNVLWVPPATFTTFCDSNLRSWPFDSHKCTLRFGSWIYSARQIDIMPSDVDTHIEFFVENPEWEVANLTVDRGVVYSDCCPEPLDVDVKYNVTISRRSTIYHTVIFSPAFVIIILILLTFWLPAQYGEKILLNGIVAIIIILFLLYFSQKLNVTSSQTPLIVLFYNHSLYMVCFSTLISVLVINLTRLKHQKTLPWVIKRHLDGKLGELLLLDHINDSEIDQPARTSELREHIFDEHFPNDVEQINCSKFSSLKTDYLKLATAIDRIAFVLYLIIFIIFAITYSI